MHRLISCGRDLLVEVSINEPLIWPNPCTHLLLLIFFYFSFFFFSIFVYCFLADVLVLFINFLDNRNRKCLMIDYVNRNTYAVNRQAFPADPAEYG